MRLRRRLAWVLAALALIPVALLLGVLLPRPLWPVTPEVAASERILVLSGPIHTDIALPLDRRTRERFGFLAADGVRLDHPGAEWLVVGWGGRAFYLETPTWADLRAGPVLRALTVDASVLHVDLAGPIALPLDGALALDVAPGQRERIEDAVLATFRREGDDAVVIPDAAYGDFDRFFEARGAFNLVAGCNTWTAMVLRAGGLRTGWWTPLPGMLTASLRLHAGRVRPSATPARERRRPTCQRLAIVASGA